MPSLSLDSRASNLNVQEYKDRWEARKIYTVVPQETQVLMQVLVRAALEAQSHDDCKAILTKAIEVMDWVWPIDKVQRLAILQHEDVEIRVPTQRYGKACKSR